MSGTSASRYLPTLTEVVSPETFLQTGPIPVELKVPCDEAQQSTMSPTEMAFLTQNVINKITPLLEEQVLSVVLPALQLHIEAAVREAIKEALAGRVIPD